MSQIQAHGGTVLAISADTVDSHAKFAQQYHLPFPLLADPDKKVIADYGALGSSGYANRWTFIIGPDGNIKSIDRAVNAQFARDGDKLTSRHAEGLALLLSDWKAKIGAPIPDFSLPATDGSTANPFQMGKKGAVVVFMSDRCPVSHAYEERIKAIAAKDPDIALVAVVSNADQTMADAKRLADRAHLGFPVAWDQGAVLADHFGAVATPTVWVMDAKGNAVYRGAVDDSQDPKGVSKHYLLDALVALQQGKPIAVAETRAFGCAIARAR